jgi:hypothetical protein
MGSITNTTELVLRVGSMWFEIDSDNRHETTKCFLSIICSRRQAILTYVSRDLDSGQVLHSQLERFVFKILKFDSETNLTDSTYNLI